MKDCNEIADCAGRREFLVKSAFIVGGLVLTLSGAASALNIFGDGGDVVVLIDDKSPLNKVGGSLVIDSSKGKIIILRTGDESFVAFSAKCTHRGTTIGYDSTKKRFVCPNHGSKFDIADGSVLGGPADDPLAKYPAKGTAASVTVTVGS